MVVKMDNRDPWEHIKDYVLTVYAGKRVLDIHFALYQSNSGQLGWGDPDMFGAINTLQDANGSSVKPKNIEGMLLEIAESGLKRPLKDSSNTTILDIKSEISKILKHIIY